MQDGGFPVMDRLRWVAERAVGLSAYLLYAFVLFWTVPAAQGPGYDGPHRLPGFTVPQWTAVALVLALPVLLLWRRPVAAYAALLAGTVLAAEFGARSWAMFAAATMAICYLALVRPVRISLTAAAAMVAVWAGEMATLVPDHSPSAVVITTGQLALYAVVGWGLGYAIRKRREYGRSLRGQEAARAVMAERLRIARELHDMVAHSIGIIAVLAGAAGRVIETRPEQAREALAGIETTSRETLTGLQRMLSALRHAEFEEAPLAYAPGLHDLQRLTERAADAGIRVDVSWHGERRPLPPEIDQSAFRVIQEAVTNVVRHSGTHACRISIGFEADQVSIEVVDNGRGPANTRSKAGGFGLLGTRERVAMLSGQFSAGPRPEGGFRVAARLPT